MNDYKEMPIITFSDDCTFDLLDMLNGKILSYKGYGLAVRIWLVDGPCITAAWGTTDYDDEDGHTYTTLMAWDSGEEDYRVPLRIKTDNIRKVEVL